jgi:para-nitrobenzyl esterase
MSGVRSGRHLSFKFSALVLVLCLAALALPMAAPVSAAGDSLIRVTRYGLVEGKAVTGIETTNKAWAWLGVPYAKPPVGMLRWKAPRDPEPWSGIRQAKTFSSCCMQPSSWILNLNYETYNKPVGSEDSLYLNVWTPQTTGGRRPVIIFFHGGANLLGESATPAYNGANFAAQNNAVFVSCNYRLGQLGWFAPPALRTGDPRDDSGNYGTLDCIQALKWIRDNIAAFGGDPNNVTISGQSAGGMMVCMMLVSPLATGLFQRAFCISGGPLTQSLETAELAANATIHRFLVKDGYASNYAECRRFMDKKGKAWIASYLRSKPAKEFISPVSTGPEALTGLITNHEDGYVIPKGAVQRLSSGNYNRVPTILSSTRDEMKFFLPVILGNGNERGFAKLAREIDINSKQFQAGNTGEPLQKILSQIWWPVYNAMSRSLTDASMAAGVKNTASLMAKWQKNVYTYRFDWDEEPKPIDFLMGAAHAMDVPFLFHNFDRYDDQMTRACWCKKTLKGREKLSSAMTRYLAQFMRTGNPNRWPLPVWKPWTNENQRTMIFDTNYYLK